MKTMLFAMTLALAGPAAAQYAPTQQTDGRNEAAAACGQLTFDSDRAKCIAVVNQGKFFDVAAANACGELSFGSDAVDCMKAITDKVYLPAEVTTCGGMSFSSDAVKCFKNGGKPVVFGPPQPPYDPRPGVDSYILESLKRLQSKLEQGNIPGALVELGFLMKFVEEGMKR